MLDLKKEQKKRLSISFELSGVMMIYPLFFALSRNFLWFFAIFLEGTFLKIDDLVKSRKIPFFVIPAKAGIQFIQLVTKALDSGFHRSDDFLRDHQNYSRRNMTPLDSLQSQVH